MKAVIIIVVLLIAVVIYGMCDANKLDRWHDADQKRFKKRYGKKGK